MNWAGGEEMMSGARKPEIVADAAHAILNLPARQWTGRFFLDDEVLLGAGANDFGKYDAKPGAPLIVDLFAEAAGNEGFWVRRLFSECAALGMRS